jgi:hypothetical protein
MAGLALVKDWNWTLYRLDYSTEEGGEVKLTKHVVSTPNHIEHDATGDRWPRDSLKWVQWTPIREVSPPRHVGSLYGLPVSESGWETARRLMKETHL